MKHARSLLLASGLLFALGVPVSAQYSYEAIDLGSLGANISSAHRINNYGQIVVTTETGASWGGALWQPTTPNGKVGTLTSLGSLGGSFTTGSSINDLGQVTGVSEDGSGTRTLYLWQPSASNSATGTMVSLGVNTSGQFPGINNYGQVVGSAAGLPALWTPSTANATSGSLSFPIAGAAYGSANAINTSGQIAATAGGNSGTYHAVRFTPNTANGNTGTTLSSASVGGAIGANTSTAEDINDNGVVVGAYFNPTTAGYNPIVWNGTTAINLAPSAIGGDAFGINTAGDVVGYVSFVANDSRAFFYNSGAGLVDLNTMIDPSSGWQLTRAYDINDHGQIVGEGYYNGQFRAFLLAPAAAPEPGTLGLLALGALSGIVARRWKGQKR